MEEKCRLIFENVAYMHSYSERPEEALYERHCHNGYELLYVVKGEGTYRIEGAEYPMRPGSMLIARPCEFHCISPDKNMEYERDVLIFNERALYDSIVTNLDILSPTASKSGVIYIDEEEKKSAISAIFKHMKNTSRIFDGSRNKSEKQETMLCALLTQLLLILSLEEVSVSDSREENVMGDVIKYVNRHLFDDISLDTVSQRFFISKYYLCRAFKEQTGTSLLSYVNAKRIVMSDQLLARGESATEVAYKVGFGSYSSFYRAYVKQNGHSPVREKNYRQSK